MNSSLTRLKRRIVVSIGRDRMKEYFQYRIKDARNLVIWFGVIILATLFFSGIKGLSIVVPYVVVGFMIGETFQFYRWIKKL